MPNTLNTKIYPNKYKKKVLITGCTGFLGRHICNQLLSNGYSVIATNRSADTQNIPLFSNVNFIPFDINESSDNVDLFQFFDCPDIVIHTAWHGLPNYHESFHIDNAAYHMLFLKNLLTNGLKNLTVIGTCFEYGLLEGELKEDMQTIPNNNYAIAKNKIRTYISELQQTIPFSLKWLRLFYSYGKGQHKSSLLSQLEEALMKASPVFNMSNGDQIRDFLSVDNAAQKIVAIALQEKIDGIINVCSGNPVSIVDFVNQYLKNNKKQIILNTGHFPYKEYEPFAFWGDTSKMNLALNHFKG